MKILLTSTMALGALCILTINEPAHAAIIDSPNFHLAHGGHGGGHGGGHMGGEGHWGGGHGDGHHHGDWGHDGWGYGAGGFGLGVGVGALGATILNGGGDTYQENIYQGSPYGYSNGNCYIDEDGYRVCTTY